jgi:hypothetical protein
MRVDTRDSFVGLPFGPVPIPALQLIHLSLPYPHPLVNPLFWSGLEEPTALQDDGVVITRRGCAMDDGGCSGTVGPISGWR